MNGTEEREAAAGGRFPDLARRSMTAAVIVPPVLFLVWIGGLPLQILLIGSAGLLAREWSRLTGSDIAIAWTAAALAAFSAAVMLIGEAPVAALAIVGAATLALVLVERRKPRRGLRALSIVIAVVPVLCFDLLRGAEGDETARLTVLWLIGIVWATDIAAYLAGRLLGGPKLVPRISPKKTWAGALGGLAGAMVASSAFAWGADLAADTRAFVMLGLAALGLSAVAQVGDLAESAVKRHCKFKDSGGMLPGHGGLLDRVDGLIAAAVALTGFILVRGEGPF